MYLKSFKKLFILIVISFCKRIIIYYCNIIYLLKVIYIKFNEIINYVLN